MKKLLSFGKGGYRGIFTAGIIPLIAVLALSACIQPVERDVIIALDHTPTPTLEPTPTFTPTPTPLPTATPPPTATPTPPPTPTAEVPGTPNSPGQLFLNLEVPEFGSTVRTKNLTVSGTTLPGTTLEVGGELVRVDQEGRFQAQVTLQPGQNVKEVKATGLQGDVLREFVFVNYERPFRNFELYVPIPRDGAVVANQSIQVEGSTTVPEALVTVNGVAVSVDDEGRFSTTVRLTEGENPIEVLALHPETNQVLPRTITVIYSPP